MIKGFRHTAKALFNILEAKYENQRWPCQQYQIPSQVDALMKHVLRRINEAPDLYFMVYTIVDGIFFSESNGAWAAEYCESMPSDYLHTVYADLHRMVVMFGFDGQRRDLEHMINSGIGFEPWIWYWAPDTDNEVHKEVFRLVESAHTTWDGAEYGMWLQWFETKVAQIANGDGQTRAFGAELVPNPRNPKPYQMKVTELDVVLVNDLGVDVAVNRIFDAREVADTDRDGPKSFQLAASASRKIVTRDGEVWSAEYTVAGQKRRTEVTADCRWGVFQEVWLSEIKGASETKKDTTTSKGLSAMRARELKDLLQERGLETRGTKATLIERILRSNDK